MTVRKVPELHNFNDMYTPPEAMDYITPFLLMNHPYLSRRVIYWEACYGEGHMYTELFNRGFSVVGRGIEDCFMEEPDEWDFLITNPPFNGIRKFIRRFIELGKPFASLARIEHLGGVEICDILQDVNFQVIIPEKRINYITPKMIRGETVGGASFHSVWLTLGLNLPKQINYVRAKKG